MNYKKTVILLLAISTLLGSVIPASAWAAATPPVAAGQALEIGPPVLNLTADPGQTLKSSLSLRDISTTSLVVTNEVNDFTAQGEDGTPKVILDPAEVSPYSFKTWLSTIPPLTLKSREIKNVPITIKVPATAAPGGYYGIIRFTGTAPEVDGTGVSLNASLGALVFIRVNGAVNEKVSIGELSANNGGEPGTFFQSTPLSFLVRLKNEGNIYEQPTGLITITDMFNHTVATLPVNAGQLTILPQTVRRFTAQLDSSVLGSRLLFGQYRAHLDVTYGSSSQKVSQDIKFTVFPLYLIIGGAIALVVAIIILVILIKRYNRYIVGRASKR